MTVLLLALLMGVVAGPRVFHGLLVAVSLAAHRGAVDIEHARLAFMGDRFTPLGFSLLAALELVTDQLPSTPQPGMVPPQFGAPLASGAPCGATIRGTAEMATIGVLVGAVGAVAGMLGGARARAAMAAAFGNDRPAALVEDAIVFGAVFWIALGAGPSVSELESRVGSA